MNRSPAPPVLVVEDDPDVWSAVVAALELEGFEVHAACDGLEALEVVPTLRRPSCSSSTG